MMKIVIFSAISMLCYGSLQAQFAGPVGSPTTTAMYKDSSAFVAWAVNCTVQRGYLDIADPGLGTASYGDAAMAAGIPGNGVVTLGDSGVAVLTFLNPIMNGPGFDFAVFENAFNDEFLELAVVEVSSDGENFVRFPATSNTPNDVQVGSFENFGDATLLNNLAGKYREFYGTPFDLEELAGSPNLDVHAITHVKIIDVVGTIDPQYATYDQASNAINDPYPTAFAAGGFDLDAVGVIHEEDAGLTTIPEISLSVFPNPLTEGQPLNIQCEEEITSITIFQSNGVEVYSGNGGGLTGVHLAKGMYTLNVQTTKGVAVRKLVVW
ncbi:MAG TPA: T9SS type A sorting domain-containing protein [Fluviicola sp.]|nr:T9SS type A sorting domain-containing protein [Fluviicola sp.]